MQPPGTPAPPCSASPCCGASGCAPPRAGVRSAGGRGSRRRRRRGGRSPGPGATRRRTAAGPWRWRGDATRPRAGPLAPATARPAAAAGARSPPAPGALPPAPHVRSPGPPLRLQACQREHLRGCQRPRLRQGHLQRFRAERPAGFGLLRRLGRRCGGPGARRCRRAGLAPGRLTALGSGTARAGGRPHRAHLPAAHRPFLWRGPLRDRLPPAPRLLFLEPLGALAALREAGADAEQDEQDEDELFHDQPSFALRAATSPAARTPRGGPPWAGGGRRHAGSTELSAPDARAPAVRPTARSRRASRYRPGCSAGGSSP